MEGKSGPEYVIRRKVGKRPQPDPVKSTPTDPVPSSTPVFVPRPIYPSLPLSSSNDLRDYLAIVKAREWVGTAGAFRLASYDLLSDAKISTNPALFTHCSPNLLASEARFSRITAELNALNAHIMCLQGVNQYQSDLLTAFPHFEAFYTDMSAEKDGVAVLYDTQVFEMTQSVKVVLSAEGHSVLSRPNTGLIAVLRHKRLHREVLVATAQISQSQGLAQLGQIMVLTKAVAEVVRANRGVSVIIAGSFDFNPGSDLYAFVTEGKIALSSLDLSQLSNKSQCDTAIVGIGESLGKTWKQTLTSPHIAPLTTHISHLSKTGVELRREGGTRYVPARLPYVPPEISELTTGLPPLCSAYQACIGAEAFPTEYSGSVLAACDYIWQGQAVQVTKVLKAPSLTTVVQFPSAPNHIFPSDHISVAADFQFSPCNSH